ncbi:hypothetical protein [uncultured Rhodoferax sp.]|uniref:hypothetical protein n=1 Tax=uncultured Rhodoferax sp. TaxID=223188 RepID=UPI0025FF3C35|nr:hypothetical protein [uncultured Rhodoferax sp.]
MYLIRIKQQEERVHLSSGARQCIVTMESKGAAMMLARQMRLFLTDIGLPIYSETQRSTAPRDMDDDD